MPSEHSDTVGGSSAARVIMCPGSVRECRKAPPKTTSVYAKTGTVLHNIMEEYLLNADEGGLYRSVVESKIGQTIDGVKITKSLYEQKLVPCMDWFENVLSPDAFLVETKCRFPGIPRAFGTADIIYRKGTEYGVADWKFGDGVPVKVESNAQIMFYLWAAFNTKKNFFPRDLDAFRGHIFQPFRNEELEKHQVATFSREELAEFAATLREAVGLAETDDAPLQIGDHCKWCAAKAFCPQLRDVAAGLMEQEKRTPAEMLEAIAYADSLEQLVKEIRAEATDYVRRGGKLEGWKLVDKLSNRAPALDEAGMEAELRSHGLRVKDIYPKTLGTAAHIERVAKARDIKLGSWFDELYTRKVTGDKLVPASSKTPEKVNVVAKLKKLSHVIRAKNLRG